MAPHQVRENYYGMLRLGSGSTSWTDKQGVAVVQQFVPGPAPLVPDQPPANYLNPFLHPPNPGIVWYQGGNPYYGTLSGQVVDQYGVPIAGAWVRGDGYVGRNSNGPIYNTHFTYTDEQGYFELVGFDPEPYNPYQPFLDDGEVSDRTINSLQIYAFASSSAYRGDQWTPYSYTLFQPQATYVLQSLQHRYDVVLDNEVIWGNDEVEYTALSSITALDVLVIGEAGMKAPLFVDLKPGFHAVESSEFHAHLMAVPVECMEVGAANLMAAVATAPPGQAVPRHVDDRSGPEVELVFHNAAPGPRVEVFPNPGRQFQVHISPGSSAGGTGRLEVHDLTGRLIVTQRITGAMTLLDLTHAASGGYVLHVDYGDLHTTHQLTVP